MDKNTSFIGLGSYDGFKPEPPYDGESEVIYACNKHGDWNALKESACPRCMRTARVLLMMAREALENERCPIDDGNINCGCTRCHTLSEIVKVLSETFEIP